MWGEEFVECDQSVLSRMQRHARSSFPRAPPHGGCQTHARSAVRSAPTRQLCCIAAGGVSRDSRPQQEPRPPPQQPQQQAAVCRARVRQVAHGGGLVVPADGAGVARGQPVLLLPPCNTLRVPLAPTSLYEYECAWLEGFEAAHGAVDAALLGFLLRGAQQHPQLCARASLLGAESGACVGPGGVCSSFACPGHHRPSWPCAAWWDMRCCQHTHTHTHQASHNRAWCS
jgi:hypothetical protein